MPKRQTKAQKETVERVMHEFKHHELETRGGRKVKNRKQAVAIALREAGASKFESPQENRRELQRTKRRERQGKTGQARREGRRGRSAAGKTRKELYAEAQRRHVRGRSKMDKQELERALAH